MNTSNSILEITNLIKNNHLDKLENKVKYPIRS